MRREAESVDGTGNVYDGFRNAQGFRDGKGSFNFADGSVYVGEWKLGLRHGLGEFRYSGGGVYKGQWAHDLKHG